MKNSIKESVIDFPKQSLCPDIWEKDFNNEWHLKPHVEQKIIDIVKMTCNNAKIGFNDIQINITGSITSNSYTENADIDVHLHLLKTIREPSRITQSRFKQAYDEVKREFDQNGLTGDDAQFIGKHPIEIYYQPNEFQDLMSVGCYDMTNHKWLIGPEFTDVEFNPYDEYMDEIKAKAEKRSSKIRNTILSVYEQAILCKKMSKDVSSETFVDAKANLQKFLHDAAKLYEMLRDSRKRMSDPTSKEEAMKYRNDRSWKIADATFKILDKFGYLAILRKYSELDNLMQSNTSDEANIKTIKISDEIIETVKDSLGNEDKLMDSEQLNEGMTELVAPFALSLALLIPGLASADTIRLAKNKNGATIQEIYSKENIFKQMLNNQNPNAMFGNFKFWQACNILSLTLFGEGRSEIQNDGFDLICDSILNRTASNTPDLKRVANICIGRKEGRAFQYSFWNGNKTALNIILNQNDAVVPTSITNIIERRAWETCIDRSIEILTGNYKVTNKKINSYYVTNMKNPPDWADDLTDIIVAGKHTFGYLASNDPRYTDMATMLPINRKHNKLAKRIIVPTHAKYVVVKSGDTLSNIAQQNDTTVDKLMQLNRKTIKNPNRIAIGQKIRIA